MCQQPWRNENLNTKRQAPRSEFKHNSGWRTCTWYRATDPHHQISDCKTSVCPCIQTEAKFCTNRWSEQSTRDQATWTTSLANPPTDDNPEGPPVSMSLLHGILFRHELSVFYVYAIGTSTEVTYDTIIVATSITRLAKRHITNASAVITIGIFLLLKRRRRPCTKWPSVNRLQHRLDKHSKYESKIAEKIADNRVDLCLNHTPTQFILTFRKVHKISGHSSDQILRSLLSVRILRSNPPLIIIYTIRIFWSFLRSTRFEYFGHS